MPDTKLESNFACRCSEEARGECDEVLSWAKTFLKYDPEDDLDDFASHVVATLSWRYRADITGLFSDQWFGVSAQSYGENGLKTFIQCDRIEDGLAFTLRKFYDEYGEERGDA